MRKIGNNLNLTLDTSIAEQKCIPWRKYSFRELFFGYLNIISHWALSVLPITLCSSLGYCLGRVIGPKHQKATQRLRDNITRLRPDVCQRELIDDMVKRSWGNYGRVMAEFSVLRRILVSNRTEMEGLEHLNAARVSKRPIIFLLLHLGNWELVGHKLYHLLDGRVVCVYQKLDNSVHLQIAKNTRREIAHILVTEGPFVGKKIYNKLREGHDLIMAVDEFVNDELNTPSFGRNLLIKGNLTRAVRFAKLTNAMLCPVYATRTQGARFLLHILPLIELDFADFDRIKLREAVAQLDSLIDPIIRQYFDQWYYAASLDLSKNNIGKGDSIGLVDNEPACLTHRSTSVFGESTSSSL